MDTPGEDGVIGSPPVGLPAYRVLTGPDDDASCHRVSDGFATGYRLAGSPALTFHRARVIVAQTVLWGADGGETPAREGGAAR
jgi:hypothetical protein